jgi:hypothetical protein
VAAIALIAVASWRLALLASVIAAAIAATRMRYARLVALALLALILGLASVGLSAGSNDRTGAHMGSAVHCAPVNAARAGQLELVAVRARGVSCPAARRVLAAWARRGARRLGLTVGDYTAAIPSRHTPGTLRAPTPGRYA